MQLTIVTPQGKKYEDADIHMVSVPTEAGEIGIMDDHIPLMSNIAPGRIEIVLEDDSVELLSVSKGIIQVERDSKVRILANTAERASEIDIERAREARRKAEEMMAKEFDGETNYTQAKLLQAKIEKELAREHTGNLYKDVGK